MTWNQEQTRYICTERTHLYAPKRTVFDSDLKCATVRHTRVQNTLKGKCWTSRITKADKLQCIHRKTRLTGLVVWTPTADIFLWLQSDDQMSIYLEHCSFLILMKKEHLHQLQLSQFSTFNGSMSPPVLACFVLRSEPKTFVQKDAQTQMQRSRSDIIWTRNTLRMELAFPVSGKHGSFKREGKGLGRWCLETISVIVLRETKANRYCCDLFQFTLAIFSLCVTEQEEKRVCSGCLAIPANSYLFHFPANVQFIRPHANSSSHLIQLYGCFVAVTQFTRDRNFWTIFMPGLQT